ncbi:MAG: dimethylsulfonioproprionate lyase family protein [Pseudomonadota bacterium]
MSDPLADLLREARRFHEATPALADFAAWPDDLSPDDNAPIHVPAADLVAGYDAPTVAPDFVAAIRAAVPLMEWRQSYTEAEVGAEFLSRYCYFELFGPRGHFRTDQARGYVGYWGEGLHYDWHDHEAEELYFVLGGSAQFMAEGKEDAVVSAGETQHHTANQRHAMTTGEKPILTYVLWRGAGLAGVPAMSAA